MGNLLTHALAASRRAADREPQPAPLSRDDQIIAEGSRRRLAYRHMNPAADTAMVYGVQIGYLHGMVRELCNEVEADTFERDQRFCYQRVRCDALGRDVWVGFTNEFDADTGSDELQVCEVRLKGVDIADVLDAEVKQALGEAALARFDAWVGSL